jgi:hypothetical protein
MYSVRVKESKRKQFCRGNKIWVPQDCKLDCKLDYVTKNNRGRWETKEEAQAQVNFDVEEVVSEVG